MDITSPQSAYSHSHSLTFLEKWISFHCLISTIAQFVRRARFVHWLPVGHSGLRQIVTICNSTVSTTFLEPLALLLPNCCRFSHLSPQASASCAIPASCNGNLNHIHKRVSWAVPTGLLLETCSSLHSQGMVSGNAVYCRRHPWQGAT